MNHSVSQRLALFGLLAFSGLLGANAARAADADAYLLSVEPAKVQDVVAVRDKSKNGDDVAVVGRIGGRVVPWIKGAAAFSIVDVGLTACNERPEDTCPTPWDFCCEADLPKKTMLVTFVDSGGKLVRQDARELLSLKELQTVVIQGKVKRDVSGNVSLVASKIFVRAEKPVVQ